VQIEKIAAAELSGLDAMMNYGLRGPPDVAAHRDHAAVDFGILAADVCGALAAKCCIERAQAREHLSAKAEVAAENRRARINQSARAAAVIQSAEEAQQLVLQPGGRSPSSNITSVRPPSASGRSARITRS